MAQQQGTRHTRVVTRPASGAVPRPAQPAAAPAYNGGGAMAFAPQYMPPQASTSAYVWPQQQPMMMMPPLMNGAQFAYASAYQPVAFQQQQQPLEGFDLARTQQMRQPLPPQQQYRQQHQHQPPAPSRPPRPAKQPRTETAVRAATPTGGQFTCQLPGCPFSSSSRKHLQQHEEDRHLIYAPGREPKPYVPKSTSAALPIEGTTIKLDTPEAIEAWRAERRKKWPTTANVSEKERVAALNGTSSRSGRGGRGGRGHDRGGRGGRGTGRGRGRPGWSSAYYGEPEALLPQTVTPAKRPPSPAQSESEDKDVDEEAEYLKSKQAAASAAHSDQVQEAAGSEVNVEPTPATQVARVDDKATSDAGSDSDDDDDDDGPPEQESTVKKTASAPEEAPQVSAGAISATGQPHKFKTVVCRYWRQGRCNLDDESCPFLHSNQPPRPRQAVHSSQAQPARGQHQQQVARPPKIHRPAPAQPKPNPFARADPFLQMQERDIQQTVSDLLYVLEFLHRNDYLRGVERYAGECDDKSGVQELA